MKRHLEYILKIIITTLISILAFDAIATMVSGSLGKTPESTEWNYILILYIFLATLGAIAFFLRFKKFKTIATILSAVLSYILLGFYYGGSITNNNSLVAIITGLLLGALASFLSIKKNKILLASITPIATIAAYGFAFYTGTNTINLLMASRLSDASLWGIVCLIYIGLTTNNLLFTLTKFKN